MATLEATRQSAFHWFKSLDINRRISIAEWYSDSTGDTTNIVNGFTNESERWILDHFSDDINNYNLQKA